MAHNGGLVQLNVASGGAFNNKLLETDIAPNPKTYMEGLSAAGYPTVNPPAGYQYKWGFRQYFTNLRPGNYVLKWDGQMSGQFDYGGSFNNIGGGSSGRFVFTGRTSNYPTAAGASVPDPANVLTITGVGSPTPTNIRICHIDDEAALDAGNIWQANWLATITAMKPGTLRFLDVFAGSSNALLTASDLASATDMTYGGPPMSPSEWATGTITYDSVTDTYTIPKTGFTLTNNASVYVRFPAASGAAPKANINGTGAKAIVFKDGGNQYGVRRPYYGTGQGYTTPIGCVGRLWYNKVMDKYLLDGGSSESVLPGTSRGWPLSVIVNLCNTIGAHCWINIPYPSVYPQTDMTTTIATYMRDNLAPGLKFKAEYTNETFNGAIKGFWSSGFSFWAEKSLYPAKYTSNSWGAGPVDQWTGRCTGVLGKEVEAVYGAQNKGVKYDVMCSFQTATNSYKNNGRIFSQNFALETADQMYSGSPAGYPAKNYITCASQANYYASWVKTPVGTDGTSTRTDVLTKHRAWPLVLYYIDLWNDGGDIGKAIAERWVTDGCMTPTINGITTDKAIVPSLISDWVAAIDYYTGGSGSGLDFYLEHYEGGNSNDFLTADPDVRYQEVCPDGVLRPATPGVQAGYKAKANNLLRAFRYDKKMRWVGYYLIRKLIAANSNGRVRLPSRYQHQGGLAWAMYNPNWTVTSGNVAANSNWPNLAGIDADGESFRDYSNGRVVLYGKTT